MQAADDGMDLNIDCLLHHGADPNMVTVDKRTALMIAVENGNDAAVRDLLEAGANVNVRDKEGQSALDLADGNVPVIKLLKQYGAQAGTPNRRRL